MGEQPSTQSRQLCHGCQKRPIRDAGELVSWLEDVSTRRLYCIECANECAAGLWDGDPDEADG